MTSWQSISTPNELLAYAEQQKCVICQSSLDEPICFDSGSSQDDYFAFCDCAADKIHYSRMVSWQDPKRLTLTEEEVKFEFEDRFYRIKQYYSDSRNSIINEITITEKDVDGNEDEEHAIHATFLGKLFDFKKFDAKQFAERVNVARTFQ